MCIQAMFVNHGNAFCVNALQDSRIKQKDGAMGMFDKSMTCDHTPLLEEENGFL